MRRRPGIAGLQRDVAAREQYRAAGEEVRKNKLQAMQEQLSTFRSRLEAFAQDHRAEIRRDPVFRAQFHAMCAAIGVDPLASNKGMWAQALGFGDFYYELGVQIVEACIASRPLNGGLMELRELTAAVVRRRGGRADPVSEDDVVRALKKLKVLGGGYELVAVGRRQYVRSVPGELDTDRNRVLEVAADRGWTTQEALQRAAGWGAARAEAALQGLLKEGLALVDDGASDGARRYYCPCMGLPAAAAEAAGGAACS